MITRIYATIYCFGKNKSVDEDIVKWGGWIRNHQAKQWWWCDDVVALHCDKTKRTRIIVNRQVISITSFQKHYHSSLPQNSTCFLLVMMRWSMYLCTFLLWCNRSALSRNYNHILCWLGWCWGRIWAEMRQWGNYIYFVWSCARR